MNGLGNRVSALCLALAERNGVDYLQMAHTGAGHSMHAFAQLETIKGRIRPVFSQVVPALTIDDACAVLGLAAPDHVKLDVDGTEAKILRGGRRVLPQLRSIAMEVKGVLGQAAVAVLDELGFVPAEDNGPAGRNRVFFNPRRQGC